MTARVVGMQPDRSWLVDFGSPTLPVRHRAPRSVCTRQEENGEGDADQGDAG
jgi:hypothetical protein